MSANTNLNRIKSPYLTAFALYLGVNVYGLQGILVGPLGLAVMTVLYENMIEEESQLGVQRRKSIVHDDTKELNKVKKLPSVNKLMDPKTKKKKQ